MKKCEKLFPPELDWLGSDKVCEASNKSQPKVKMAEGKRKFREWTG